MIKGIEAVLLSSEDAKALAEFYKNKVGFKLTESMEIGDEGEEGYDFSMEGAGFYIIDHSKVKGKNPNPERVMFNLEVDDIEEEVKRLDEAGVKKVQEIYHVQNYGLIATFEDLDGNYFQLVQVRPI